MKWLFTPAQNTVLPVAGSELMNVNPDCCRAMFSDRSRVLFIQKSWGGPALTWVEAGIGLGHLSRHSSLKLGGRMPALFFQRLITVVISVSASFCVRRRSKPRKT